MWRGFIRLRRSAALDQVLLIVESGEVCRKLPSAASMSSRSESCRTGCFPPQQSKLRRRESPLVNLAPPYRALVKHSTRDYNLTINGVVIRSSHLPMIRRNERVKHRYDEEREQRADDHARD